MAFGLDDALMALGGLGALGSSAISFVSSGHGMRRQYRYQKALQEQQNKFYERLSNTAHQREVADLQAAGLNPILSATGGSGAASAMGAAGQSSYANDAADSIQGLQTALAYRQQKNENKLADADVALKGEQKELTSEQIHNAIVGRNNETRLISAQVDKYINDIKNDNLRLLQDIKESNSRVGLNSAQSWRSYNQALGYSESESKSYGAKGGISRPNADKYTKKRGWSVDIGGDYSYSNSRTW